MASPYPGMDPYLEDPAIWSGVHAAILAGIFEQLGPAVRPKYAVRYEERVYVTSPDDASYRFVVPDLRVVERDASAAQPATGGALLIEAPVQIEAPDLEVRERSLHIIDVRERSVVAVIELLSPSNKEPNSAGRASFLQKRREVLAGAAHWMEVDLLRAGVRTANLPGARSSEYQVFLSRAGERRTTFVWPTSLRKRLAVVGVPLRDGDPDVPLDLQAAVDATIQRGSYDLDADYSRDPDPPLAEPAASWADKILREEGRRATS